MHFHFFPFLSRKESFSSPKQNKIGCVYALYTHIHVRTHMYKHIFIHKHSSQTYVNQSNWQRRSRYSFIWRLPLLWPSRLIHTHTHTLHIIPLQPFLNAISASLVPLFPGGLQVLSAAAAELKANEDALFNTSRRLSGEGGMGRKKRVTMTTKEK